MSEWRIVERVLIVDDDEAVATGLATLFECLNIETKRLYLASFALQAIAYRSIHLLGLTINARV